MAGKSDSDQGSPSLLVAMNLYGLDPDERRRAAEIGFRYAARAGIDRIKMQANWFETPPKDLAGAVRNWLKTGKRGLRWNPWRWTTIEHPSPEDIALALAASPYIVAVNLFTDGLEVVAVSDAEDLSLQINRADWDRLRPEFERLLGSVRIEVENLAG